MTGATRAGMTSVQADDVHLDIERFGPGADPLILLVGGTPMLSWPDALCERPATGGRHVVRYDLRDSGTSTTLDPDNPAYDLRSVRRQPGQGLPQGCRALAVVGFAARYDNHPPNRVMSVASDNAARSQLNPIIDRPPASCTDPSIIGAGNVARNDDSSAGAIRQTPPVIELPPSIVRTSPGLGGVVGRA